MQNPSQSIIWGGDISFWWFIGLVFAFLLVMSLGSFMLYRHLKLNALEDQECDNGGEPFVSGSLLLLYSQKNEEAIVGKVRKMKDRLWSKYMVIIISIKLKAALFR